LVHPIDVAVKSIDVAADSKLEFAANDVTLLCELSRSVCFTKLTQRAVRCVGGRQQECIVVEGWQSIAIEEDAYVPYQPQSDVRSLLCQSATHRIVAFALAFVNKKLQKERRCWLVSVTKSFHTPSATCRTAAHSNIIFVEIVDQPCKYVVCHINLGVR
jgi:hypothetical protein